MDRIVSDDVDDVPRNLLWKLLRPRHAVVGNYLCGDCRDKLFKSKDKAVLGADGRVHIRYSICASDVHKNLKYSDKWHLGNSQKQHKNQY